MRRVRPALLRVVLVPAAVLLGWGCTGSSKTDSVAVPVVAPTAVPAAEGPELFADVTKDSGVDFTYRNGEDLTPPHLSILESLGGGVAAFDYDGDGLLDLYVPGGGYFDGPDKKTINGHPGKLFRNLGGGKFRDVTAEAGLATLAAGGPWFYSHAAVAGDFDRDGFPDLLVTGWGRVALFKNLADGKGGRRFEDVSAAAGLDKGVTWATSAAWADFDGDGFPDLYACQYVNWSFANHPKCDYDGKTPDVCPPKKFSGLKHKVWRNNGNGTFSDVSDSCGLLEGGPEAGKGLGVLAADFTGDGKPDVYVANDTVANFYYVNKSSPGKILFDEKGRASAVALDGGGQPNGSMGLDSGDPVGDLAPSIWVTNYENELHALYRNIQKGGAFFTFHTPAAGIAAIGQKYVGWGTGFVDLEHRGYEDLFIVNGHAIRYPTGAARRQKPVLMQNDGKKFKDITPRGGAYFRTDHLARGLALVDFDNDGRVDAVVSHMNDPVAVLRNVAPGGNHWVGVGLKGKGNACTVGAKVVLSAGGRQQARFAKGGGSYASTPDRRLVFGLGSADKIDKVTVSWPDGKTQEFTGLPADKYHVLEQK